MKLFIGCASSDNIDNKYLNACDSYLEELFKLDNDLVFGGYNKGLMYLSYQKALKYNRKIIGIVPNIFKDDLNDLNCHKEIVTNTINERTDKLIEESDVIIFMPGGVGTIYELLSVIESKRSGLFNKPIIIYNCYNFFDKILLVLEDIYSNNFTSEKVRECYYVSNNVYDTINYISNYYNNKGEEIL